MPWKCRVRSAWQCEEQGQHETALQLYNAAVSFLRQAAATSQGERDSQVGLTCFIVFKDCIRILILRFTHVQQHIQLLMDSYQTRATILRSRLFETRGEKRTMLDSEQERMDVKRSRIAHGGSNTNGLSELLRCSASSEQMDSQPVFTDIEAGVNVSRTVLKDIAGLEVAKQLVGVKKTRQVK